MEDMKPVVLEKCELKNREKVNKNGRFSVEFSFPS